MLASIASLLNNQKTTDALVNELSERVAAVERNLPAVPLQAPQNPPIDNDNTANSELLEIRTRCDDAENRLWRSNLLFLGNPDSHSESWLQSEEKILEFCRERLGLTLDANNLERSHRLGRFCPEKNRPIIVKFLRFKDKTALLASGSKLKGSQFAVREDLSPSVRLARSKLFQFATPQNVPFKIRFDKLRMLNKCFVYDAASDRVKEFST